MANKMTKDDERMFYQEIAMIELDELNALSENSLFDLAKDICDYVIVTEENENG